MPNRSFSTNYWDDPDFEEVSYFEKYIYGFLFTAPSSAICGYYQCTYKTISDKTGVPIGEVKKAIHTLDEMGKIVFDSGLIFIPAMAKRQDANAFWTFAEHCAKQFRELHKPGNRAFDAFKIKFEKEIFNSKNRKSKEINNENSKPINEQSIDHSITLNDLHSIGERGKGNEERVIGNSFEEGSGEKLLERAPVEENQKGYFEVREMFRELFAPDRIELTQIKHGEFIQLLHAHGEQKLRVALIVCSEEGWKSVSSLKDYLRGKLKPKRERYAKPEQVSHTPKYIPPKPKKQQQDGIPMPDDVKKLIDGLSGKFTPKEPDRVKVKPPIADDSPPLPPLSDDERKMLIEAQESAKRRISTNADT
jgi:hypothetical protein